MMISGLVAVALHETWGRKSHQRRHGILQPLTENVTQTSWVVIADVLGGNLVTRFT